MNYHIIKTGESIQKIANIYNLTEDEIIQNNKHITSWTKLIPGTRIKLPNISEALSEEIDEVEPFIEDYYPRLEVPIKEEVIEIVEEKPIEPEPLHTSKPNKPKYNYYPYYMYPYMYNNYYRRSNKKRSR